MEMIFVKPKLATNNPNTQMILANVLYENLVNNVEKY